MIIKWQSRNLTMHKFITPRVGSDVTLIILTLITTKFQSTLPVWGATLTPGRRTGTCTSFQSTLPVWGATGFETDNHKAEQDFNPRSPCGERRNPGLRSWPGRSFQSTHPLSGATPPKPAPTTHPTKTRVLSVGTDFNPRSPCGERQNQCRYRESV